MVKNFYIMSHPTSGGTNRKNSENMVISVLLVDLLGFKVTPLILFSLLFRSIAQWLRQNCHQCDCGEAVRLH